MRLSSGGPRRDYAVGLSIVFALLIALPLLWQFGRLALPTRGAPLVGGIADLVVLDRRFERGFPFRKIFLGAYNAIRHEALGVLPDSVVRGTDGWLFYRSEAVSNGASFDDYAGRVVPTRAELDAWRQALEERQRWLAARGILYLPVVAPNKHTIYPDMLPVGLRREHGTTRLDRVMAALGAWPEGLLDLRPVLRRARLVEAVYFRTDTHWNDAGALAAAGAILAALSELLPVPPLPPRAAFTAQQVRVVGDISRMILLPFAEETELLRPAAALPARCGEAEDAPRALWPEGAGCGTEAPPVVTTRPDPALPSAVVFADSFGVALRPLLAQAFRRTRFEGRIFDPAVVEAEHPEVVIQVIVERDLPSLFLTDGPRVP